jgi:hypothetical protein
MMIGRSREAFLRFAERRRREDEARRLQSEVPRLRTLRLEIEEHRGSSTLAETKHVRLVVVSRAPALFVLPCGDGDCRDGGHDLTDIMMKHLCDREAEFVVEHACAGDIRGVHCDRIVRVRASSTFGDV